MDHSPKLNGYKPKSIGDVIAIATLLALFLGVVQWFMKLEHRIDAVIERQLEMRSLISRGVLPVADERIRQLESELHKLSEDYHSFVIYHRDNFVPARNLQPRED